MGSRKYCLSLIGLVAWSSTAADTIFSILEATAFSNIHIPLLPVAATSSILNVLSLFGIVVYCYIAVWRIRGSADRTSPTSRTLITGSFLLSTAALIASLVSIVMIKAKWKEMLSAASSAPGICWTGFITGQIAVWAVSFASQMLLFLSQYYHTKLPKIQLIANSGPRDSVMSEYPPTRPSNFYMPEHPPPTMTIGTLPSPTFSAHSSHSLRSFRESLRHIRPITSRSTLISRSSANRETRSVYSDRHSVDNTSHLDPFDSWDTSSVCLPARDVVTLTVPSKGTTLEPIPGSRPNSPARALDGPFVSEPSEEEMEDLTPPPRMMPDVSRPPSPVVSEAHIHPLFRSATPEPAPLATLGTSIIASPLASQAITCPAPAFSRMRSSSRGASPHVLKQARSFTRDRATSLSSRSRSSSPQSRVMTPPIPDFVLNSSPRSSMSGSRRVNLQYSQDR